MKGRIRSVLGVLVSDNAAHPLQTLTTLLGVAVGIAVIVAIRLASDAALNQFRGTYDSMAGVATHQLTRVGRLDPARLLALRAHPSVDAVQPVVAATVLIPPAVEPPPGDQPLVVVEGQAEAPRSLRLVGVDPFQAAPFLQLSPEALEAS